MNWICDPGHAWLKVPLKQLYKLKIHTKISCYSYLRGKHAYLEEDQDAYIYAQASGKDLKSVKHTHTNRDSRVRNYSHYSIENANMCMWFNNQIVEL